MTDHDACIKEIRHAYEQVGEFKSRIMEIEALADFRGKMMTSMADTIMKLEAEVERLEKEQQTVIDQANELIKALEKIKHRAEFIECGPDVIRIAEEALK